MNICFAYLSYPLNGEATSGVGSQVRLLAHALIDAGHTASVIDLATRSDIARDDRGVNVYRVRSGAMHWFIGKLPVLGKTLALPMRELEHSVAVWRGVRKANRRQPIDLIEGTETGMLMLALLWRKSPVVIRLHGERYTFHKYTPGLRLTAALRLSRWLQRIALRRAKLLISPSFAHAREIRDELRGVLPPIAVVPNAVGIESSNGHFQNPDSTKTVLYAGRIEKCKGIKTLLSAAAQIRDVLPESKFIFAGGFNSSLSPEDFESQLRSHRLNGEVKLMGPVDRESLRDLYKTATIAVVPSHYETFGLAALEPMAFGTPVIASRSGALPEVVVHERTGKLVTPGDCEALADAIIELLTDPAARQRMGRAAMERAALFDVHRLSPLNHRLYEWSIGDGCDAANNHVFFSAHLDDAVLSCGGTIDRLVSRKKDVRVITVFAGEVDSQPSAFARHLHAKWKVEREVTKQRRDEDRDALTALDLKNFEHWGMVEAPYRRTRDGRVLYGTYEELSGSIAAEDRELVESLTTRISKLDFVTPETVLYFPLSLGQHIDHRILSEVGNRLRAQGFVVRFYEDFPYAEDYCFEEPEINWLPRSVTININRKVNAASAYASQLGGLGNSEDNLERRLRAFGQRDNSGSTSERYWEPVAPGSDSETELHSSNLPLRRRQVAPRLADFKEFLGTFRWHDLDELLPSGTGICIDLGCGNARHKRFIEVQGYDWIGLDRGNGAAEIKCDGAAIPFATDSVTAVVAWQVLEYAERPEKIFSEASRVLETGGVFCGSVSFLEPVHGHTYYNISPLILERLLKQNGFADIEIKPGLNGFALMFWTWLRRTGIPGAQYLAVPATLLMLLPLSALLFSLSYLMRLLGLGTGHFMRWLSQTAPLEFAGHVMFCARKKAEENCTSLS